MTAMISSRKKTLLTLISLMASTGFLFAQPYPQVGSGVQGYSQMVPPEIPEGGKGIVVPNDSSGIDMRVLRNRVEYQTVEHAAEYKDAQVRRYGRRRILGEVFDAAILMTPVKRVIRPIDTIGISPTYITQIIFPHGMKITDVKSSFPALVLEFSGNLLRLRPDPRTFFAGNLVLVLNNGKKNYPMTIFVNRYYQNDCKIIDGQYICRKIVGSVGNYSGKVDDDGGKGFDYGSSPDSSGGPASKNYSYAYNNLSAYYVYTNPQRLDDLAVVMMYEKIKRKKLNIGADGDYVDLTYDGITYRITRDERFGTVNYRGKKYRISAFGGSY